MNINNTQGSQDSAYALEPRVYEVGYHILSSVDEGNIEKEREALVAIITKFNGIVISEEMPALVDLAYDMDKIIENKRQIYSQAYFGWIKFDLSQDSITSLEKEVEALKSMLRFILIKTVRENTIISEKPYKLAKTGNKLSDDELDGDSFDEVERPIAEEASSDEPKEVEAKIETETETAKEVEVDEEKKEEVVDEESKQDDLTKIEGIGPKIAEIFVNAGIKTFSNLSDSKVGDLRNILEENKLSSHDPKTWSKQATLAKNEKWEKLAELQDELKGGK